MPNIRSSFSFKSLKLDKKSVKTQNFAGFFFFYFFIFFFFTLWATDTYQKRKLRPPPKLDNSWFNTQACDVINPGKNPTHNFCKL